MTISAPHSSRRFGGPRNPAAAATPVTSPLSQALLALAADPQLDAGLRAEYRELGGIADPNECARAALELAQRLKRDQSFTAAAIILQTLQGSGIEPGVAAIARNEWAAMTGGGTFGKRAEFLAGNFFREASDPRMIVPMLAAGVFGELAGAATLSRLAAVGRETQAARALAGMTALSAETLTFAGLHRALTPETGSSLANDLARAGLSLAAMRAFSFLGDGLGRGWLRLARYEGSAGLQQAATNSLGAWTEFSAFAGLWAARRAEAGLGLSAPTPGGGSLVETLASYLSLRSGARLGQWALRGKPLQLLTKLKVAKFFRGAGIELLPRELGRGGVLAALTLGLSGCRSAGIRLDRDGLIGLGGLTLAGLTIYGLIRATRQVPPQPGEFTYRISPSDRWLLREFYLFREPPDLLTWTEWRKIQAKVLTAARLVAKERADEIPKTWRSVELRRLAIDILTQKELFDLRKDRMLTPDPFPSPPSDKTPKPKQ